MGGTILLVEDEPSVGELVRGYLQKSGYRVIWVRSGEEALVEVERHPVKMVVLDIGLPGMDGFDVCRALRGKSQVPILMLTARDEEPDRVVGLEVGADASSFSDLISIPRLSMQPMNSRPTAPVAPTMATVLFFTSW